MGFFLHDTGTGNQQHCHPQKQQQQLSQQQQQDLNNNNTNSNNTSTNKEAFDMEQGMINHNNKGTSSNKNNNNKSYKNRSKKAKRFALTGKHEQQQQQQNQPQQQHTNSTTKDDPDNKSNEDARSNDGSQASSMNLMSSVSSLNNRLFFQSTFIITGMILLLGFSVAGAFLGLGFTSAYQAQRDQFERMAIDLTNKIESAWTDYVNAAGVIHGRCRDRSFTRQDFRDLYEYLTSGGLDFQAAQFDPNITREERNLVEEEARTFYNTYYPHVDYRGIIGFESANSTTTEPRSQQDYYFPIHYMEPIIGNEKAIDLDYHSSGSRRRTVLYCLNFGRPALTDRLRLVQEKEAAAYGVIMMHPGYNLTSQRDVWPRDLASIVVRIRDLLKRATESQGEGSLVYLYDRSDTSGHPLFLGGVQVTPTIEAARRGQANLEFLPEMELQDLIDSKHRYFRSEDVPIANKIWTTCILGLESSFQPDVTFVIIGGVIICLASMFLAGWVFHNTQRVARLNRLKADAEAERAALIVDNAKQAAKAERDLNDFIAHEIRNPVSAAISACSFVKTSVNKANPLADEESRETTREDVRIIDNALKFVNDLLRNMLDMHRAANKQLKVTLAPTDVLHDVLEPTASILTQRGGKVEVIVECPPQLFVMSDRLRLKQVVLNLGRNSSKFVDEGFIKLCAKITPQNTVLITVEDSGPGIPESKRNNLFKKYQESLDMLCQGTGIGLFLCMNLVELMGGRIYLDEDYDSGVPGQKGARFVVDLQQEAIDPTSADVITLEKLAHAAATNRGGLEGLQGDPGSEAMFSRLVLEEERKLHKMELPDKFSVLFVDDDPILRKLFARTVKTVCPTWDIREASNGETALKLVETEHFDLIFMDMYMASIEKQLLGTETVRELRARGISCRICGLSANDKESEFLDAGADAFTFKPFPCEATALRQELGRILQTQKDDESENGLSFGMNHDEDEDGNNDAVIVFSDAVSEGERNDKESHKIGLLETEKESAKL